MLNNQQDAEDAVQTTFLRLFRNITKFNFRARFTTYLFSITRNVCYDILNQRRQANEDLEKAKHIAGNVADWDQDITRAISNLPERTRECFIMFAIEGYPQNEIADLLNIKTGTVKALIFQARQKLITWLSD
jgi:RNA polymerase sigma-70 factor (ECF subfamily)